MAGSLKVITRVISTMTSGGIIPWESLWQAGHLMPSLKGRNVLGKMRRRMVVVYEAETLSLCWPSLSSTQEALFSVLAFGFEDFVIFLPDLICLSPWLVLLGMFVYRDKCWWCRCGVLFQTSGIPFPST